MKMKTGILIAGAVGCACAAAAVELQKDEKAWSDVDRDYRAYPELYAVGHLVRLFWKGSRSAT